MKPRHYAVITNAGHGHVYPVLPICVELVNRGNRVSYISTDQYAHTIVETGAQPVPYRGLPISHDHANAIGAGLMSSDESKAAAAWKLIRQHLFADTEGMLSQIQKFYTEEAPDVVLYDRYSVGGRILANWLGVPGIQLSAHFAYYDRLAIRENGVCRNPDFIVEWSKEWDSFLSEHGVLAVDSYWHVENLNIHLIPKLFQHNSDYFDERFCFVGALLNRPFRRVWTNNSNGKAIILISSVSTIRDMNFNHAHYYRTVIDALTGCGLHCILSIGTDCGLDRVPRDFEINRHASHLEILPHAALSISHGGMGTTLESVYNGVPTLTVPMSISCKEVAYRAEELGLGVSLDHNDLSADNLKSCVMDMLGDAPLRDRVQTAASLFRQSGGASMAADRIESYLSQVVC